MADQCRYTSKLDHWRCPEEAPTGDGLCIFHDPDLNKDVSLLKARFKARLADEKEDPLRFDGAIFPDGISFEGVVFARSISFDRAQFHGRETSFLRTEFRGQRTSFDEAEFYGHETFFGGAQFHGRRATFERAKFRAERVTFLGAEFCSEAAVFDFAQFHGERASFERAQFHGDATSFWSAQFRSTWTFFDKIKCCSPETFFSSAQFYGEQISFSMAEFYGVTTSFDESQFHSYGTSFNGAHFRGQRTSFGGTQFHSRVISFGGTQFHGHETSFDGAQFHGQCVSVFSARFRSHKTSFGGAQFHGQAVFKGHEPSQVFLEGTVDFQEISVGEKGELVFDWVDLSRTQFLHADLSRVKFLDVTWDHRYSKKVGPFHWGHWRSRVYDEADWREARRNPLNREKADTEFLSHLGRLYRALKAYYREAGEHHLVGHFHCGLMEVQWYQKRKWRKWLSWETLYRYSSGYGEGYAWAGLVLLGLLVGFAGVYWWLGVPPEMQGGPWWKQGLHALLYSLQAGTLGRVGFYQEKVRLAARYLHLAESMLVPVQFGFFLFALRNRFRR